MAIMYMTLVLFVTLIKVFDRGILGSLLAIARTGLNVILLYYTFKGKKWAKIILIILFSIELFSDGIVVTFLIYSTRDIITYIPHIISIAINGLGVYIMRLSPSFNEYLKSLKS